MAKKLIESAASKPASTLAKKSGTSKVAKETPKKAALAAAPAASPAVEASPKSISAPKSAAQRRASKGDGRKAQPGASTTFNAVLDKSPSDIIYIGHIPAGFEEREMRKFFNQFGDVVRLKLVRNKKTLASRGHAFVKFESSATATTVSESINGYFIGERQLVSHVVPRGKVHDGLLRTGARSNPSKASKEGEVSAEGSRKRKTGDEDSSDSENDEEAEVSPAPKPSRSIDSSMRKKQRKLDALGMDYDFVDALKSNTAANSAKAKAKAAAPPAPPAEGDAAAPAPAKAAAKAAKAAPAAQEKEEESKKGDKKASKSLDKKGGKK